MHLQQPQRAAGRRRTALAWTGFALSPLLFAAWAFGGDPLHLPFTLRYVLPILSMVLLGGVVRRRPFAVLAMLLFFVALFEFGGRTDLRYGTGIHSDVRIIQMVAVDVAVSFVAATSRRWVSIITATGVLLLQVVVAAAIRSGPAVLETWALQYILAMVAAWFVGNSVRQRRLFAEARAAETAHAAVQAERLRIARELHDMIAHSMGVIAMQAGMGRRVIGSRPEEARQALAVIEDTGRETLAALRRMLGTLRRAEPEAGPAPLDPTPGLADLNRLAERSRDAGLHVEVRDGADVGPLPPDVDLSAYRIIQEAVTNVARHAGTDRCEVVVERHPDALVIEVLDNGRGGPATGRGYGIPGMRERVSLLGGDFAAGPRPGGGFRVAARIPLPAGAP
ncbi:sensor histidine kinase [Dactylosporangium fulvum]|uniref:histidine kinase n=1 Tax=Dactylosporangium fulvum TaxID=53359 RepID=A0ABY5VRU3_9ACTN|nr:sensor histidine kinase [Dactylosporangium fulvum]UWP79531.1 sensor histidine kinase [Dactylosporangium fulvum]